MLEQMKLKSEDYAKFKRDRVEVEVLEKNRETYKKTIRNKAAKAIETIASKFKDDVFKILRPQLEKYL